MIHDPKEESTLEYTMKEIYVETVRVEGRHRRDLGDIGPLADSIAKNGLIHPITVTAQGYLIAGQRRLEAYRKLGHDRIPARIITDLTGAIERLEIERDENTARKAMTPEELVSLGQALEALERPAARQRQGARTDLTSGSVDPEVDSRISGKTVEVVADALGMSGTTYRRARTVVEAAKNPGATPEVREVAQAALAEMNETGRVSGAYETVMGTRPPGGQPRSKYSLERAAGQRRVIASAATTLSGMAHGLRLIAELHPDITSTEAAQWVDGLSESRHAISALIKLLKERTNAAV